MRTLTALEEAEAYRHLMDVYGLTQDDIARRVGKSRPAVANALRLLALPEVVKAQLENDELSAGHARAVLAVEGDEARVAFAREITSKKLPKSEAERLAKARRDAAPGAHEPRSALACAGRRAHAARSARACDCSRARAGARSKSSFTRTPSSIA